MRIRKESIQKDLEVINAFDATRRAKDNRRPPKEEESHEDHQPRTRGRRKEFSFHRIPQK